MPVRNIGQQIKTIRTLRGISQKELGNMVGVSHATISYIENNIMSPNDKLLTAIKAALGWTEEAEAALEILAK